MKSIDLHLWNLCNFGVSYWSVLSLVENGYTLESFLDETSELVLDVKRHKPKLYRDITEILKNRKNDESLFCDYSLFVLLSFNLSIGIIEKMLSDSITMADIETRSQDEFRAKYA